MRVQILVAEGCGHGIWGFGSWLELKFNLVQILRFSDMDVNFGRPGLCRRGVRAYASAGAACG